MSSSCLTFLTTQLLLQLIINSSLLCQSRNALIVKQNLLDAVSVEQNQINVDYR